jgi:glycosyltransferase involved in cell wall biosynthesis
METVSSDVLQALIITKDEQANIRRTLDNLTWLESVVVLDSFSVDGTVEILKEYPNVEVYNRTFDTFANQCNFGLTLVSSKWVLSLDADFVLTPEFIEETRKFVLNSDDGKVAYFTRFKFLVFGKELSRNNTTKRAVLFQREFCSYYDDGHAHRLQIEGAAGNYRSYVLHDDRKPLDIWLSNQDKYSIRECEKLVDPSNASTHSLVAKIRKTKILAPFIIFFYCLFAKGLVFDGWYGWHYTLQRTFVEMLFALRLIERTEFDDGNLTERTS